MAYFSIAHILRLQDGMYAVRSAGYPGCEGRDVRAWPAREKFRTALSAQVREMIGAGEMPPGLYASLDEAQAKFGEHVRTQLEAEDRQPNTVDYAVIVDLDLPAVEAERYAAIRLAKLLPESRL